MPAYVVNGVRLDENTGRVTHVRWGEVHSGKPEWVSQPTVAEVSDVVAALDSGSEVTSSFMVEGHFVFGPRFVVVAHEDGSTSVDLDKIEDRVVARDLRDMAQI
ncbi:phosphatidylserine/phosphatidylglycerophosphate/cardiolipin synthase [Caballeronia sp. LZ028]|uniref:phosphatidylserine/phosphatidylglycerophosphate/ cardiolipin synthase n=1 Tax=Caballeronia sp. LZ028 TaxID=3038563 RepID=UPI0028620B72|nr:phosphatidylserine/phosphatidylglycerophosphate/cardiolipin synthase [Caballeronia sp. LZ028]MDR5765000.1 phosphatidylserine/phosphatidylglycerophosphate/cardiolipin synthase [Caballeronia sp. LZ028]